MCNAGAAEFFAFGLAGRFVRNSGGRKLQRKDRADGENHCPKSDRGLAAPDRIENAAWYRGDYHCNRRKRRELRIGLNQFFVAVDSAGNDSTLRNRIDLLHDEHAEGFRVKENRVHVPHDKEREHCP